MCGRYTYHSSKDILSEYKFLTKSDPQVALALDMPNNFNVSPGNVMPIIVRGEQEHRLEFAEWGLVPFWAKGKDKPIKLINAKEESLTLKPTWKKLVQSKRCIVPARGFYEWKSIEGKKQPYYITPKQSEIFSFAGLYDSYKDEQGNEQLTYVIITTSPNKEMADVHNRMPAILNSQSMDAWLEPGPLTQAQIDDILHSAPDNSLNLVQVSTKVNNAKNNSQDLIYPLDD